MAGSEIFRGSVVEVGVSCRGLRENSRYSSISPRLKCILYAKERGRCHWKEVDRTEFVEDSLDPDWNKTFLMEYFFEEKQHLRFAVFDWTREGSDDPYDQESMGACECSLAEVVTRPSLEKYLSPCSRHPGDSGIITILSEEQSHVRDVLTFQLSGSNLDKCDVFTESDPFFTISKTNADGTHTLVYRSDYIKNDANPDWPPVKISSSHLCSGDYERQLKVQVFDYDDNGVHDFIGEFYTTVNEMIEGEGFQIVLWDVMNPKKKERKGHDYQNSGQVILKSVDLKQGTTFLDYLRGGVKLHLVVAVDFTLGNGEPCSSSSLHFMNGRDERRPVENPYTLAIRTIGDIFQDYAHDRSFLSLGFGGSVNGRTSHCFPLNGNSRKPYCYGVEGIVDAYYDSLDNVLPSEPTCFAPVIKYVRSIAENMAKDDASHYIVLLIVSDGGVTDLSETRKLLVDSSNFGYPLSLILVGTAAKGQHAGNLNVLDGDTRKLTYRNQVAKRDIVQCVEMARYTPDGRMDRQAFAAMAESAEAKCRMAKELLAEVPCQVVDCMKDAGIKLDGSGEDQDMARAMYRFEGMRLGHH